MTRFQVNFLLWHRDNPTRPLSTDIDWAKRRYFDKHDRPPNAILVPPGQAAEYANLGLRVDEDAGLQGRMFMIYYRSEKIRV